MSAVDTAAVRSALEEATARFARILDTAAWTAFGEVFLPDAEYVSGGRCLHGVDAITAHFAARPAAERTTRHLCGGLTVDRLTPTAATTTSVWTSFAGRPGGDFGVYMVADFLDDWVLADGTSDDGGAHDGAAGWRLARRVVRPVFRDADRAPGQPAPPPGVPADPGPARTAVPRRADLTAEQQALYDAIVEGPRRAQRATVSLTDDAGGLLGPFGLMLLSPVVGAAVQQLGATLRFSSTLADRARELLVLQVAARERCRFEWTAHERAARAQGVTAAQLAALLAGDVPDDLSEQEACVLELERLLHRGPTPDAEVERCVRVLGRDTVADVVWTAGYYLMVARALDVFRPAVSSLDEVDR